MVREVGHKSEKFPLFQEEGKRVSYKITQKVEERKAIAMNKDKKSPG